MAAPFGALALRLQFASMANNGGVLEELVAATMIGVEMGVDDDIDIVRQETDAIELRDDSSIM